MRDLRPDQLLPNPLPPKSPLPNPPPSPPLPYRPLKLPPKPPRGPPKLEPKDKLLPHLPNDHCPSPHTSLGVLDLAGVAGDPSLLYGGLPWPYPPPKEIARLPKPPELPRLPQPLELPNPEPPNNPFSTKESPSSSAKSPRAVFTVIIF
uniref:Putative vegetative cell wall protein gp1 n=1 Tax=Rhipicephalus microplus TaxID=6941 RepID=A0A6G5ACE9_RHIMP